jgi:predicted MPP superfamily phosphohydrolase
MITRRQFVIGLGGGIALGAAFGSYAFAVEPRFRLVVVERELVTPKWPHARPLRIVVLSDIHACEPWMPAARIRAIVDKANTLGGDIILLLGDFTSSLRYFRTGWVRPRDWGAALAELAAPLGVHAILGNHDWWSNPDQVTDTLTTAGVTVYQNRAERFSSPAPFWLAGTDSMIAYRLGPPGEFAGADDLPGTLARITDDAPAILMAHEPDLFVDVPDRFALTLSGHTHGGQVWVPFLGRPVIPSAYGQRFAYGHIVERGRDLIVSAGLGCSLLPVRFGVPPEITVVTLRTANPIA